MNRRGDTPLHRAAAKGHVQLVSFLVAVGASIDAKNGKGWTPLHWATFMERDKVVARLLKDGALMTARDKKGKTPMDIVSDMKLILPSVEVGHIDALLSAQSPQRRIHSLKRLCIKKLMGRRDHAKMVDYLKHLHSPE